MGETAIWLLLWSTLLWISGMLRKNFLERRLAKILLFPGLALDAMLRATTCLATATPIERLCPLAPGKPFIKTGKSHFGGVGESLGIVLHTILLTALSYYLLLSRPEFLDSGFAVPPAFQWSSITDFWEQTLRLPILLGLSHLGGLFLVYSLGGAVLALAFDFRRYCASVAAWLTLGGVVWLFAWLGVKFGFLSRGWFLRRWYVPGLWSTLSLLIVLTLIGLLSLAIGRGVAQLGNSNSGKKSGH